jgi:hypothetical protein
MLNNPFGYRFFVNFAMIMIGIVSAFIFLVKNKLYKKPISCVMLIISAILLPLATESIVVMAYKVDSWGPTGILMIPTMVFVYILVVSLGLDAAELIQNKYFKRLVACMAIVIIWINCVYTNVCINVLQLEINQTSTVADIILNKIVDEFGYEKGTKLLVSGHMEAGVFEPNYSELYDIVKGTSASYGYMWNTYSGNENCWILYYKQYKGVDFSSCDYSEYKEFIESDIYDTVPVFPNEGSIVKYKDMIVVKMSKVEF